VVKRFLELLEANGEDYWSVPQWEWETEQKKSPRPRDEPADSLLLGEDEDDDDDDDDLYRAAYEDVVYRDSTADGVDDDLLEWGSAASTSDLEFEQESQLLHQRLAFLSTVAHLFHEAALLSLCSEQPVRHDLLDQWRAHTCQVTTELVELLKQVHEFPLALDSTSQQALEEFDRRRMIKDALLEQIVGTCVETVVAVRSLSAVLVGEGQGAPSLPALPHSDIDIVLLHALFQQDGELLDRVWELFLDAVRERCLLYVPLSQGGDPEQIVQTRSLQRLILDLVDWLPRQGLFLHAYELLQTAQEAEHATPVKQSSVTEFDRIFDQGFRSMVETLVLTWKQEFPDMPSRIWSEGNRALRSCGC